MTFSMYSGSAKSKQFVGSVDHGRKESVAYVGIMKYAAKKQIINRYSTE